MAVSNIPPIPNVTVAQMQAANPHVAAIPSVFLKDFQTEITAIELRAHTAIQGVFAAGLPASCIPVIYKNPTYGVPGLLIGIALGILLTYFNPHPNISLTNFQDWAERSAAMNNPSKVTGAAGYGIAITGNTLANIFAPISDAPPSLDDVITPISNCSSINPFILTSTCSIAGNDLYALFQGVFMGAYSGSLVFSVITGAGTDVLHGSSSGPATAQATATGDPTANAQDLPIPTNTTNTALATTLVSPTIVNASDQILTNKVVQNTTAQNNDHIVVNI